MKMLGFMDLGDAYDSPTTASYGEAHDVTLPTSTHESHWWRYSTERGYFCLGCHALATWPIARTCCPLRYRPPTELSAAQREYVRGELEKGRRPGEIAREVGCYVDLVQRVLHGMRKKERRRRRTT